MTGFPTGPRKMLQGAKVPVKKRRPLERNRLFKHCAVTALAILLSTAPAIATSLFDPGPRTNPATNRCNLYDASCKPRQLFVRPPEPSSKNNPLRKPARKLILPRDLSGTSSPPLLLPGEPNRRIYRALACSDARRVIRHAGYRNIRTVKCGGKFHHFTALRRDTKFLVNLKVRATTGKIVVVGRSRSPAS